MKGFILIAGFFFCMVLETTINNEEEKILMRLEILDSGLILMRKLNRTKNSHLTDKVENSIIAYYMDIPSFWKNYFKI